MTELKSVDKSYDKISLTLDDLEKMRIRVVNTSAYIDLLLEWAELAEAEIIRLRKEQGTYYSIKTERNQLVKCIKCDFIGDVSGGICPDCGGMLLSRESLEQANKLASQWEDNGSWTESISAEVWADEFCKRNSASDHGTMLGWFANAITAGYDHVKRENEDEVDIAIRVLNDHDMYEEAEKLTSRANHE